MDGKLFIPNGVIIILYLIKIFEWMENTINSFNIFFFYWKIDKLTLSIIFNGVVI